MSRKALIPTAPLPPTTQQAIWGRLSWGRLRARSLLMGVAIGGRHTVTRATTTPTRRRTVVPIGVTVTIIQRLTMTTPLELTVGMGVLTDRTARRLPELVTIHTLGRTLEGHQSRHLTAAEVPPRHTIRTQASMRRPGKVPARMLNGVAPTSREETRALPWATTRPPMEQLQAPRIRRGEKWRLPARSGGTAQ